MLIFFIVLTSVAEPHHFYAAPTPGKIFVAAPAPTLLYSKAKFLKLTKVEQILKLSCSYYSVAESPDI
jgi:hypothetical protein